MEGKPCSDAVSLFSSPNSVRFQTNVLLFYLALIARKSGIVLKGRYCVVLRAVDETFAGMDPNSFSNSTICIDSNHEEILLPRPEPLIGADPPPVVDSKPARSGKKRSSNKIAATLANFTYPERVELYTSATKYARIAQPSNMYDQIIESKTDLK